MTETVVFPTSVRLTADLRARIAELAARNRRSMNAQIVVLLEQAIAGVEEPLAPPLEQAGASDPVERPRLTPVRQRRQPSPCPHRTPKGAFCKRCNRMID